MAEPKVTYHQVTMRLCSLCLDGKGGMCHEPGCALIRNRAPDLDLWSNAFVESIDGVGFFRDDDSSDYHTSAERKALVMEKQRELEAEAAVMEKGLV